MASKNAYFFFFVVEGVYIQQGRKRTPEHHPIHPIYFFFALSIVSLCAYVHAHSHYDPRPPAPPGGGRPGGPSLGSKR
jgi:hypothetical protein